MGHTTASMGHVPDTVPWSDECTDLSCLHSQCGPALEGKGQYIPTILHAPPTRQWVV